MTDTSQDSGVIQTLLKQFKDHRLPEALAIKKRVDQGACLGEHDIAFLEKIFEDANHVMPLIERHPELQPIASRAVSLYHEITEKALENEKKS